MGTITTWQATRPLRFALFWIASYVLLTFGGDAVSAAVGTQNSATALVLLALSAGLLLYLGANRWLTYYGLRRLRRSDFTRTWFYVPLAVIVALQLARGVDTGLRAEAVVWVVLLMVAVGFLEELIFRGFLFQAIRETGTVEKAVVISGVTFGIGHVVNLARGMSVAEQVMQVLLGISLGVVLALLFSVTGTIVPLVVFHTALNILGNVTREDAQRELVVVAATLGLSLIYAVPLLRELRRQQKAGTGHETQAVGPASDPPGAQP